MKGIICNVLAVAFGGLAGALFGRRLPEHFRTGLNAIFGICAMGMGMVLVMPVSAFWVSCIVPML